MDALFDVNGSLILDRSCSPQYNGMNGDLTWNLNWDSYNCCGWILAFNGQYTPSMSSYGGSIDGLGASGVISGGLGDGGDFAPGNDYAGYLGGEYDPFASLDGPGSSPGQDSAVAMLDAGLQAGLTLDVAAELAKADPTGADLAPTGTGGFDIGAVTVQTAKVADIENAAKSAENGLILPSGLMAVPVAAGSSEDIIRITTKTLETVANNLLGGSPHEYILVEGMRFNTASEASQYMRNFPVNGVDDSAQGGVKDGEANTLLGYNDIITHVDADGMHLQNVTVPGNHLFDPGTVDRYVTQQNDGTYAIVDVGKGSGPFPGLNDTVPLFMFGNPVQNLLHGNLVIIPQGQ